MKKLVFTIFASLMFFVTQAQATYLKITTNDKSLDQIMYPPGTNFELKTKEGYIIFKNSESSGIVEIKEKHALYVYPSWKNDPDVFVINEGKVEKVLTKTYSWSHENNEPTSNSGVTAEKELTDSKVNEGKKNLKFTLSNGIVFKYVDGEYEATLNGNKLKTRGKYLIYSKLGVLKLSFNPNNGVVWWIFEKQ